MVEMNHFFSGGIGTEVAAQSIWRENYTKFGVEEVAQVSEFSLGVIPMQKLQHVQAPLSFYII